MNEERNTGQQGKPGTYKRANRHGRNRPVLVTGASSEQASTVDTQTEETVISAPPAEVSPVAEEAPVVKKNRPRFFSTVGRKEETAEAKETDAAAARLARATRGKAASGKKELKETRETKETREPKKPEPKAVARSAPSRTAPPPRRGGFKPRHLIGILAYLLVAEFVGGYERVFLVNNNLNAQLFTIGSIHVDTSVVVFLLTLVVLLIVLARLDLVPRSLTPMSSQQRTQGKSGSSQNTSDTDFESGRNTPSMKKGDKGQDDDLYQEYRETQRYLQRRERKK